MTEKRRHYSQRTGNRTVEVYLTAFKKIFVSLFKELDSKQYFDSVLGTDCPDDPDNGARDSNAEAFF